MLYTYIIKNRMNKLHDLTSNVDYIRELIEQYKRDVPESVIPLYYVTDDELTSILANYDSSESVDHKFDDYYSKEEVNELLDQKASFDTYTTDLQFNRNDSVLTLSRNDGQQFSTIIDTGQTPVESPLTVDLTNEIDSFPINENGSTETFFDFNTSAHIYDGAQEQTITSCVTYVEEHGVSVQVSGVGTDEANISVHVDEGYSFSKNINITISVACAKGTRAILFTLIPIPAGKDGQSAVRYFLQPSATQIKINDDESYSDTTLTCDKMKQVGNGTPTITQDLILKMSIDGGAEQPYQTIALASVRPTIKVQYSLYDTDNRLYDRETIVVVKNGKKGDKGDPGQKGDPGENHVVTYSIEFSQPLINEGSTVVDINAYKIIDGAYQILGSSQCTVLGEQDAQGKIVTTGSGYFQLKVQDGFKASSIYTVVLYINNNEEVARATLGVIKNRDTLFNLKNWSEVNIGDVCYSEDTLTSSTAISDVVVDNVYNSGKYLCIKTYRKTGNEDIYNAEYWQPFNEYKNVATDLLLADKAYVKNLLLNYATAIDGNGHETVSIDGQTGRLTANNGIFKSGEFEECVFEKSTTNALYSPWHNLLQQSDKSYDNNYVGGVYSGTLKIDSDIKNAGRTLRIAAKDLGDMDNGSTLKLSLQGNDINPDTGLPYNEEYFYYRGARQKTLTFTNKTAILLGIGTETRFIGWQVVDLIDFYTQTYDFGLPFRVLTKGHVDSQGTLDAVSCCDDSLSGVYNTITCRKLETGKYRIKLPMAWDTSISPTLAMGGCVFGEKHMYFTGIVGVETYQPYFDVWIEQRDGTLVDSAFSFYVYNRQYF